jgi:hypothetical protein
MIPRKGSARQLLAGLPIVLFAFSLLSCAGQIAPSGGPPDRTPPTIVATSPDTNAVRVTGNEIILEFDKYVDRRTVEESIFISPHLGDLEFAWSGKEVTITFSEALRPRTTYVVNVGTDIADLREHNRMSAGFTLAFSTGDSIDRGSIAGQVFDDRPEGVMIYAYRLDSINRDTLNPARATPDFIMQTGKEGKFLLSNLPLGQFRLFAVRDEYKNLIYDRETDEIGMTQGDIVLREKQDHVDGVSFRLMKEDTTRPFVTGATALHCQEVDVHLNESLDSTRIGQMIVHVDDTTSGRSIPVVATFWKQAQPPTLGAILGSPLDSPAVYRVHVSGGVDPSGNLMNEVNSTATFEGTARRDTSLVRLFLKGVRDSTRGIRPDANLELVFSEPVRRGPLVHAVFLADSLGIETELSQRWEGGARMQLEPGKALWTSAWYRLEVRLDSVIDLRGGHYADSLFRVRFQTLDRRSTGEIRGTVTDRHPGAAGYFVTAESIDLTSRQTRSIRVETPGPFALDQVIEGRYRISAFEDTDGSQKYSYGVPYPFRPSERFTMAADTVRVRARWGIEGVVLPFK